MTSAQTQSEKSGKISEHKIRIDITATSQVSPSGITATPRCLDSALGGKAGPATRKA